MQEQQIISPETKIEPEKPVQYAIDVPPHMVPYIGGQDFIPRVLLSNAISRLLYEATTGPYYTKAVKLVAAGSSATAESVTRYYNELGDDPNVRESLAIQVRDNIEAQQTSDLNAFLYATDATFPEGYLKKDQGIRYTDGSLKSFLNILVTNAQRVSTATNLPKTEAKPSRAHQRRDLLDIVNIAAVIRCLELSEHDKKEDKDSIIMRSVSQQAAEARRLISPSGAYLATLRDLAPAFRIALPTLITQLDTLFTPEVVTALGETQVTNEHIEAALPNTPKKELQRRLEMELRFTDDPLAPARQDIFSDFNESKQLLTADQLRRIRKNTLHSLLNIYPNGLPLSGTPGDKSLALCRILNILAIDRCLAEHANELPNSIQQ